MTRTAEYLLPRATYTFTRPIHRSDRWTHALPALRSKYADDTGNAAQNHTTPKSDSHRTMMCLLIPAHNEELVLGDTLRSAISAGMKPKHIYVVDDASTDTTSDVALSILPAENVLRTDRSGKGTAIAKAAKDFRLTSRYRWIHIADADGGFSHDYFTVFRKNLRVRYVAATGYVKSMPGKRVSEYRVYEYTIGMELHRRIQALLGVISIIPGPTSCFRADIFDKLDFTAKALTEDFDVTLQIHRQGLGKIQFIPHAIAYTQDPLTAKAFIQQITRWNRGVMQGLVRHNVGKKLAPIDAYLSYQLIQSLLLFVNTFIWVPYMTATKGGAAFLATTFILDVFLTFFINLLVAIKSKRWDVLSAFPVIYALKWVSLGIFIKAFVEVIILKRHRISKGYWDNDGGRYRTSPA